MSRQPSDQATPRRPPPSQDHFLGAPWDEWRVGGWVSGEVSTLLGDAQRGWAVSRGERVTPGGDEGTPRVPPAAAAAAPALSMVLGPPRAPPVPPPPGKKGREGGQEGVDAPKTPGKYNILARGPCPDRAFAFPERSWLFGLKSMAWGPHGEHRNPHPKWSLLVVLVLPSTLPTERGCTQNWQ